MPKRGSKSSEISPRPHVCTCLAERHKMQLRVSRAAAESEAALRPCKSITALLDDAEDHAAVKTIRRARSHDRPIAVYRERSRLGRVCKEIRNT
ncbi:hypothetical protein EVAR_69413_1 [Eumeta japonica]|uniref:Uncharacterized protein n=1 Tax=Eumeta variegata TaxID=151549 RepID=A0A4C1ZE14_EUMVA|nr:hypothetical protein EVAR_69413_1 [Eumeta japonica]